ncbi:hypothetical protein CU098_000286, partial [Rhizopus stolonifer]
AIKREQQDHETSDPSANLSLSNHVESASRDNRSSSRQVLSTMGKRNSRRAAPAQTDPYLKRDAASQYSTSSLIRKVACTDDTIKSKNEYTELIAATKLNLVAAIVDSFTAEHQLSSFQGTLRARKLSLSEEKSLIKKCDSLKRKINVADSEYKVLRQLILDLNHHKERTYGKRD